MTAEEKIDIDKNVSDLPERPQLLDFEKDHINKLHGSPPEDLVKMYGEIPKEQKTEDLCHHVVTFWPEMARYIPEEVLSNRIVNTVFNNYIVDKAFSFNKPANHFTPLILEKGITNEPGLIFKLGDEIKDRKLCQIAIDNGNKYNSEEGLAIINGIPYPDLAFGALKKFEGCQEYTFEEAIQAVRTNCFSKEMTDFILERDMSNFQYLPDEMKTRKICLKAVRIDGKLLEFVPDKEKDLEMCLAAFEKGRKEQLNYENQLSPEGNGKDSKAEISYRSNEELQRIGRKVKDLPSIVDHEVGMGKAGLLLKYKQFKPCIPKRKKGKGI